MNFKTYRCPICGNIVVLNHNGGGKLVCCGKEMELLKENVDESVSKEKHIPVLEKIDDDTYKVKVGSVEHPMTEEHHIEYIEVITENNERLTYFLKVGEKPETIVKTSNKIVFVGAYCNLHDFWVKNI